MNSDNPRAQQGGQYDHSNDITLPDTHNSFLLSTLQNPINRSHQNANLPSSALGRSDQDYAPPSPTNVPQMIFPEETQIEEECDTLRAEIDGVRMLHTTLKNFNDSLSGMEDQLQQFQSNINTTETLLTNWCQLLGRSILTDSLIRSEEWRGGAQDAAVEDLVGELDLPASLSFGRS